MAPRPLARLPADEKREIIVACAAIAFEAQGYKGTSMREIAERVGLTKAALYHYVSSKQDLLYAIHDAYLSEITEHTLSFFDTHEDALERLRFVTREIVRTVARYKPYVTVSFQEFRSLEGAYREDVITRRDAYETLVEDCVASAVAAGRLRRALDPRVVTLFLFGACNWTYQWYREDGSYGPDELGDILFDLVVNGAFPSKTAEPAVASGAE